MIARPDTIIEGTWEEVSRRSDELSGKRVRVIVLEEAPASTEEAARKRLEEAAKADEEQAELRRRANAWLKETEKLVREPRREPPTEFEQILIEKMRKQGIRVE